MDWTIFEPILEKLLWLLFLIAIDLIGGVTYALINKQFNWEKLAEFLKKYVPYILGWLMAEALTFVPNDIVENATINAVISNLGTGAYAIIVTSTFASILGHLANFGVMQDKLNRFGVGESPTKDAG